MDMKSIVTKTIEIQEKHYKKIENVNKLIEKENPVLTTVVETLSEEIEEFNNVLLDLLEVPKDKKGSSSKYLADNYTRCILKTFIKFAATEPKYKDATIEIVLDWQNLSKYTKPVQTNTWFHARHVLDEYIKPSIKESAE